MKIRGRVVVGLICGLMSFATAARAGDINVSNTAALGGCMAGASTNDVVSNGTITLSVTDELCDGFYYLYSVSFLSSTVQGLALGGLTISDPKYSVLRYSAKNPYGIVLDSTVGLTPADVVGLDDANIVSSQSSGIFSLDVSNFQAGDELTFYLSPWSGVTYTETGLIDIDGLTAPVLVPTPEPASFLLFGTTLFGLVPFRRKLFGR